MKISNFNRQDHGRTDSGAFAFQLKLLVMFWRRYTQCRFDVHWSMEYDSGMTNDIGRAGTCLDCGYRTEGVVWPTVTMPDVKPVKAGYTVEELSNALKVIGTSGLKAEDIKRKLET